MRDTGEAVGYREKPFTFHDQLERGTTYWDWTLSPVKDAAGKVEGLVFSLVDTTARKLLEERLMIYQQIVSYSPDGIAVIDKDYRYRMIKGPYQDSSGVDHQSFLGKTIAEFLGEESFHQIKAYFDRCMTGEMVKYQEWFTLAGNDRRYYDVTLIPFRDENGQVQGVVASTRDITDSQIAAEQVISLLHEKELLLKEVHHRVKNSMNTIYNLLQMQMQSLEETAAKEVLQDATGRVQAMMVLYDRLNLTDNLRGLSLKDYLTPLVEEIVGIFPNKDSVTVMVDIAAVMLSAKQLSHIGLMVNELITNAMKYAFVGRDKNEIRLTVTQTAAQVEIVFADNGVGLPAVISLANPPGFGLRIVQILVKQMGGRIEVDRTQGTRYRISFVP